MLLPYLDENFVEAGVDEAGRGCLVGSLFVAAVILPVSFSNTLIDDSKKLSEKRRYELRDIILREAISYSVQEISADIIDDINILNATFLGMNRAVADLSVIPERLLIDGNRFKSTVSIPHTCIIKGDGLYCSIAAASILAKTFRDDYITELDKLYPEYGWAKNKSYGTAQHRAAIAKYGFTPLHRKSFKVKL